MKRPAKPIPDHDYHNKSDAELLYIARDAHKAAIAMRDVDPVAECKYLDQVNDSATVRAYRARGGKRNPQEPQT